MRKTKQKQEAGLVKAKPESAGKPVQMSDYLVGNFTLQEEKDKYITTIQLGKGIKQNDIKLGFDKDSLEFIVSQKQRKEEKDGKKGHYFYESIVFSYYRKIPMPSGADAEKITSSLDKGVLQIYIPKKESYKKLEPAKEK